MGKKSLGEKKDPRTRKVILDILKQEGPTDSATLAARLEVTPMAIRQHLYAMQEEHFIDYVEEPRPIGRPAKLWRLTSEANQFFPDAHAELMVDIIGRAKEVYGSEGFENLIEARSAAQLERYREEVKLSDPLESRLHALAKIRTREGYMAVLEKQEDGSFILAENHCPICSAAKECQKFCSTELSLFQRVLGPSVSVARTDHILKGARRCAYIITHTDK